MSEYVLFLNVLYLKEGRRGLELKEHCPHSDKYCHVYRWASVKSLKHCASTQFFFWTFFKTIENHLQKQSVEMLSTVNMVKRWWRWRLCLLVLEGHWGQLWKTEGFVGVKAVRCSDIKIQSPLSEISSPLHLLQVPDVVAIPDHCTYHRLPPTEQFQFQFQQEPVPVFSTRVQVL